MELEGVDRITADAIGEPGHRTFFVQARKGDTLVTVLVEKEQVQLLSASVLEVLSRLDVETATGGEDDLSLEEPVEPIWRAGRLSIGYDESRDLILLELEELLTDEDDEEREAEVLRLWASREQMLALSSHGADVSARGRPKCELCGNPIDPEGHACPATNGHKQLGR